MHWRLLDFLLTKFYPCIAWFIYIWIIWTWNDFGKKAQCEHHAHVYWCIGVTRLNTFIFLQKKPKSKLKCTTWHDRGNKHWSVAAAAADFTPHRLNTSLKFLSADSGILDSGMVHIKLANKQNLKKHIETVHEGIKPF